MSKSPLLFRAFFLSLSILFFDLFLFLGFSTGTIFTTSDSTALFIAASVVMNLFLIVPIFIHKDGASFYAILYVTIYLVILVIVVRNELTTFLVLPSVIASFVALSLLETKNKVTKGISLTLVILFMAFIGKVFAITLQQVPGPLTVELLTDRFSTIGLPTPITEYFGLFISTRYFDLITGPFQFLLFFFVSSLLVENYHRIIRLLLKKRKSGLISAGYGAISALGCQCESAIGIFPAATLLFFNFILIPFFFLSVALLVMTYVLLVKYYEVQRIPKLPRLFPSSKRARVLGIEVVIIVSQMLIVIGIVLQLQRNALFLFGTAMDMILNGFLIYYLIHILLPKRSIGQVTGAIFLVLSVLLMIIWFIPSLTLSAVTNPISFSMMSYSAVLSGFLISAAYHSTRKLFGSSLIEAYAVSLGLIPIVIYYLVFSDQISLWTFWTVSQQAELAILLWIGMLPFMWLTTQRSLILSFS